MSVNLQKGQRISLKKDNGGELTSIIMGLGWDVAQKGGFFNKLRGGDSIDLDASCLMFDTNKQPVDVVWFQQLRSNDGSIVHTGDNQTGEGDGDDEQIIVDLTRVPANVKTLVFTVNSFTGQNFSDVENAYCRIVDKTTGKEVAKYNLSAQGTHTAQVMAKVYRHNNEWKMHAIGENTMGRVFNEMMPSIVPHL